MDVVNAPLTYQQHGESSQPELEFGVQLVGAPLNPAATSELGIGAGCRHDSAPVAGMHDRADRSALGQLASADHTGTGSVFLSAGGDSPVNTDSSHSEAGDLHQPAVRRDDLAEPQLDKVTRHQRGHIHS
jgi:hypothetical protein